MDIRVSVPGAADRDMKITQFYDEYEIAEDEQRDIEETVNNGFEWAGLYSNQHVTIVRINRSAA
jgi:hypothetical protein